MSPLDEWPEEFAVELVGGPADGTLYVLGALPLLLFVDGDCAASLLPRPEATTCYYLTGELVHGDWLVMRPEPSGALVFNGFGPPDE